MLLNILKKEPLLEKEIINWMFDTFEWALRNFDAEIFQQTELVNPSNQHFPGRSNSAQEMAELIFNRVKTYAGMAHWPFVLVNEENIQQIPQQSHVQVEGPMRSFDEQLLPTTVDEGNQLFVSFHPYQINDPEVLISSYAHAMAHYLGLTAKEEPPGGKENWAQVTELLAVFLGFGITMANSAHTNKVRSCGSCAGPIVERMNFLSQHEVTYALAIFCHLKKLPAKKVTPYLKKSLISYFKKAMKEIEKNH